MNQRYIRGITRMNFQFFHVRAWYEEEFNELRKWLNFGFSNSIFVVDENNLVVYYDEEESNKFYNILDEKLTEDFFNKICDHFFEILDQSKEAKTDEEMFRIIVMCWPALVIFEEISNYPEYANESMLRRLIRVRENTEAFFYSFAKHICSEDHPDTYILFQGKVIKDSFEDFIRLNNIRIVNIL